MDKDKITIERIDAVNNRANVGYKEAKEILEKFDREGYEINQTLNKVSDKANNSAKKATRRNK